MVIEVLIRFIPALSVAPDRVGSLRTQYFWEILPSYIVGSPAIIEDSSSLGSNDERWYATSSKVNP